MTFCELLYPLYKSIAFKADPEYVHEISIKGLALADKLGLLACSDIKPKPVNCMGLQFPNILGVAAGLDKNGICVDAFASLGFGFVEVGTVTPLAQSGNDKPRLFRLISDDAIINRMGFNNHGIDQLLLNLKKQKKECIVGINIGKNKNTTEADAINDYLLCFEKAYSSADYVTINISSPNTPGLREFGESSQLKTLLSTLKSRQSELTKDNNKYVPLALKISPDMNDGQIEATVQIVKETSIDAIIATNTTIKKENLSNVSHKNETGGLSGRPLNLRSTNIIRNIRAFAGSELPIIGVGGIFSKEDALNKIEAGANLLQVYTGFIYKGPKLVKEILSAD